LLVAGGVLFAANPAAAQEPAATSEEQPAPRTGPATANVVQFGLGFRYGIELNDDTDLNPWGAGLGIDAGYTLPSAVYVGGTFEYFFGGSIDAEGGELKGNAWHLLGEGGYDIGLGESFVVRPKLGVGLGSIKTEVCFDGDCNSDSSTNLAMAPGIKLMLITPRFGLSLDTRYAMIFGDKTAKALIFTVGVGF
jgi:hypothetical protein